MDMTAVVAFLTTALSIFVKVVGLPDQIKSNHRRKSTTGLSSWFVISAFFSYLLWTIHGAQVHDDALIIGQGLGVLTTGIIVCQVVIYGPKNHRSARTVSTVVNFPYNKLLRRQLRPKSVSVGPEDSAPKI
jgi:uncharacterized protein with PQ loop repeat